jgi:hypothetical protein
MGVHIYGKVFGVVVSALMLHRRFAVKNDELINRNISRR